MFKVIQIVRDGTTIKTHISESHLVVFQSKWIAPRNLLAPSSLGELHFVSRSLHPCFIGSLKLRLPPGSALANDRAEHVMGAQTRNLTGMSDFLSRTPAATIERARPPSRRRGDTRGEPRPSEASQLRGGGQLMAAV